MIRRTAIAAAILTLSAAPAVAQHQHGQAGAAAAQDSPGGMMGGEGGMMMLREHGVGPAMILAAAEALGLTQEQIDGLEAVQSRSMATHREHMQARQAARERADAMVGVADMDLEAYEAALREAADHQVQGHLAMTAASVEARGLLTAEQNRTLDVALALAPRMGGGMGGMGGGGGMGAMGGSAGMGGQDGMGGNMRGMGGTMEGMGGTGAMCRGSGG